MKNQEVIEMPPRAGEIVYVAHFTIKEAREGGGHEIKASLRKREFYEVIPNYLEKFGPRWVIGPIGKRADQKSGAPYGVSYRPERVFLTESGARAALRQMSGKLIEQINAAVGAAMKEGPIA